jgi:hypothetical protein
MSLLDRIRPKWHHSDPEVRISAVRQLGGEDQELLSTLAREDEDARVRRMAVKKLEDPARLLEVSERDPNEGLRELAAERAGDILAERATSDGSSERCEEALSKLVNPKHLARVAVAAAHPTIQKSALARLSDEKALGEVVRRAGDLAIRKEALGRVSDISLLRAIAGSDIDSELALAAIEKIHDPDALHAIAQERNAHKSVRQSAEARLELVITHDHPLRVQARRKRQDELCQQIEALAKEPLEKAVEELPAAREEWDALAAETEPEDAAKERFQSACQVITDEVAREERRKAEKERMQARFRENLAARLALCQKVESLEGEAAPRGLDEARSTWQRLDPIPPASEGTQNEGEELTKRFQRAAERCESRYQRWQEEQAFRTRLEEILSEAEKLAESPRLADALRDWPILEKRWAKIDSSPQTSEWKELETAFRQRFVRAGERLTERQKEDLAREEQRRLDNLKRLKELCSRLEEMAQSKELNLKAADRQLRLVPQVSKDIGPLPSAESRKAWKERLTKARHELYKRFQDQRETEEWRRWANVDIQEKLIQKTEALRQEEDFTELAKQLRQIQEEWKRVGAAPRGKSEKLWKRFSTVRDELRGRCDAFFAENLKKKEKLCEKVEALADSGQWNKTADTIKQIQAQWKGIGPVPQKHAKAIWRRFRAPCDEFFKRRKEHLDRLKQERDKNTKKKVELCKQVEALADSTEWDDVAKKIKQLQTEWKQVGPVPHKKSEALWNRFRKACDHFFDRRKRRGELELEEKLKKKEAICVELEALAASVHGAEAPSAEAVTQKVQEAWAEWTGTGNVPPEQAVVLEDRLRKSCEEIVGIVPESLRGTPLDPHANRKRRERLCARLEELVGSYAERPNDPSVEDLAEKLKDALAANTIGGPPVPQKKKNWRAATQEVERLKANWERLGPVIGEGDQGLSDRFRKAYAHFFELRQTPEGPAKDVKHVKHAS